jgi:23S rRNA (pseudouridine1915-N3)-methyltransferase
MLRKHRDGGAARLAFVIGGPDGHGAGIRTKAAGLLSLGAMTLPHGLARVVLLEQIYRAITILSGHPYHRD